MITVRPFCSPLKDKRVFIKTELANCKKKKKKENPKMIKGKIISTTCQYSRQSKSIIQCFSKVAKHCMLSTLLLPLLETSSCSFCLLNSHSSLKSQLKRHALWCPPQLSNLSHLPLQKHFVHISAHCTFSLFHTSVPICSSTNLGTP